MNKTESTYAATCDLLVIGAGSGGVRAARRAAERGAHVIIAEHGALGGTCVNLGCIPKKLLFYSAGYHGLLERAAAYGWQIERPQFHWEQLIAHKDREIGRLNQVYRKLLHQAGVTLIEGQARLLDMHSVEVAGQRYRAQHILISTGSRPQLPELPGREWVISSDDAFFLPELPASILIVGGGYIALEFAGIFHRLGVRTILSYRGELFLRGFDRELRAFLAERMRASGIELLFHSQVKEIRRRDEGLEAVLADGEVVATERIMYAIGRRAHHDTLGLEQVGVQLRPGGIAVDRHGRSSVPSIYAIGDVADRPFNLTPVALAEAEALVEHLYGDRSAQPNYENIPTAVFSSPPLASVGLDEPGAREKYGQIEVYRSRFTPLRYALGPAGESSFIKLITAADGGRVLGAHMVDPDAAEIIQGLAIAIKAGIRKRELDQVIGIHPTSAEEFVSLRPPAPEPA